MNMKRGFTLSEVMVTMGVLGVLAAIIIPAVVQVKPDTNKVMFKKAYSTVEKVTSELINDEFYYPSDQFFADGTTPKGFNYTDNATAIGVPAGQNKFCYLFSQKLNTVGDVNCTNVQYSFTTADGIKWQMFTPGFPQTSNTPAPIFLVDVNGDKAPNCFRTDSYGNTCDAVPIKPTDVPDKYYIGVRYDGKIAVFGTSGVSTDVDAGSILTDPTSNKK